MYEYKVSVVGDMRVGKTTLVDALRGITRGDTLPTAGVEVHSVVYPHADGGSVCLYLWDSSGSERSKGYYMGTDAIIAVLDRSSRKSLSSLSTWIDEVLKVSDIDIPIVIVGSKGIECDTGIASLCSMYNAKYFSSTDASGLISHIVDAVLTSAS